MRQHAAAALPLLLVGLAACSSALPLRLDDALAPRTSGAHLLRDGNADLPSSPFGAPPPPLLSSSPSLGVWTALPSAPATAQPAMPQSPWPYPPAFDAYLPENAKQQLLAIFLNGALSAEEHAERTGAVFDALPLDMLARLPLPEGYERLPADVYSRIAYVHSAPGFRWLERQALTQQIVDALPEETRRLMRTQLGGPPPGFERVLAPSVYRQLLAVHYNRALSKLQRSDLITRIMQQVPRAQLDRLPLPAGMQQLPLEVQLRLRALVYDYAVPQGVRGARVRAFVASLPAELRPPL